MPPIPATFDDEIKALIDNLERRKKDLQDFQIPRLRTCEGPLATQQQFAAELREDIETFSRQVETLDVAVDEQQGERNRRELRQIVEELKRTLASLRKDSRAALLASKRAIDANTLSNREELLRSSAVRQTKDLGEKVAEDALMTASNNVTEALQRTLTLMQGELEKSVLSSQLLDASTASLRSASSTHDTVDSVLQTSKHLITALEKSDWLDRMLIIAALVFFILVVAFILQQRIVNRGLRLAFWWTRFVPISSGKRYQSADLMEKGSASAVAETVFTSMSAVITAASTLATSVAMSVSPLAVPADSSPSVIQSSLSEVPDSILIVASQSSPPLDIASTSDAEDRSRTITESDTESTLPTSSVSEDSGVGPTDTLPSVSAHDEL
ncbi:hypothetical protein NM688_g2692 [Phlebia brevispora]|uniref:Uncharacterized protein n=1 Tax=Phlebia brevispora TaxID=194682 RepID=A0ACC1T7X2_9APHY|nr:hypothetical protein NM688_g2692 [Phlebia brevispora]